jgi:hypothetical protein
MLFTINNYYRTENNCPTYSTSHFIEIIYALRDSIDIISFLPWILKWRVK